VKFRSSAFSLAVILSLALPAVAAQLAHGQEIAAEGGARKIRTKTVPEYPPVARQMNVTGKVKLEITITADGHVSGVRTIGGSPLLIGSATEAVKKWRYEPGPKETTDIVEFSFSNKD
jgi:protein TonB